MLGGSGASEALTRKIGPLPAWGWGIAIGGGLLAWNMMRGGESEGTMVDDDADFDFGQDLTSVGGIGYGGGGFTGGYGDTGGTTTTVTETVKEDITLKNATDYFRCPAGFKTIKNKAGKISCQKVKKPKAKSGYKIVWKWATEKWVYQKKGSNSFVASEPHIDASAFENGTAPTVSTMNLPAIAIASPDKTPKQETSPLNSAKSVETVVLPNVPPAPMFRQAGRPSHE